jgi:rare lipoprotein A
MTAILGFAGCMHNTPPPPLVSAPHYTLGGPYQADGHYYYPAENYALDATGIAAVADAPRGLTADGEIRDPASGHCRGHQSAKWPPDPAAGE